MLKKRFNLLLDIFFLLFVIETHYCSAALVPVGPNNADKNLQAQAVGVRGGVIRDYILYEGISNILYWLFDWYQKEPGLYWYKHYRSFGYRTCLLSNRFYFDFYMRTWINIPVVVLVVLTYYEKMKLESSSSVDNNDLNSKKIEYTSNIRKSLLCFMFVPVVDLNICLGDNFYLVIGFRNIIISYFDNKATILGKQIKNYKGPKSDDT